MFLKTGNRDTPQKALVKNQEKLCRTFFPVSRQFMLVMLLRDLPTDIRRLVGEFVDGPATPMTLCLLAIEDLDLGYTDDVYKFVNRWNRWFFLMKDVHLPDNHKLIQTKRDCMSELRIRTHLIWVRSILGCSERR